MNIEHLKKLCDLVSLLASKRDSPTSKLRFQVRYTSAAFRKKYDELQEQLHALTARDELLTGNLHKYSMEMLNN